MLRFVRGDGDVLVCTSIIESGIDIPQANTLIVERADMFGLSQLYQIRGRVGRSRERAYAYLLYPSAAALTRRRRAAPVGAVGLHRARRPGSRSRCGTWRSAAPATCSATSSPGHVAALGFELYMQMLDDAVAAAEAAADGRGFDEEEWEPVRLDVNVDAYVPADYIPYEQAKVDVHRRIAGAREVADLVLLREELEDRFGELPAPLENLILLQTARIKLGQAGRADGHLPRRPAGGDAARAGQRARQEDPGGDPRGALRIGQVTAVAARAGRPRKQFPAVVRLADVLLAVLREADEPRSAAKSPLGVLREPRKLSCGDTAGSHRGPLPSASDDEDQTDVHGARRLFCAGASASPAAAAAFPATRWPSWPATRSRRQAFNHWMYVAAKGNATQSVGAPVIVPNDPPNFESCIKQVREQIPTLAKTPDTTIRTDCNELFTLAVLAGDELPDHLLLVSGAGRQARHHGQPTPRSPRRSRTAKKQEFPTAAAFNAFLTETGQTLDDINYRLRITSSTRSCSRTTPSRSRRPRSARTSTPHPTSSAPPETRNLRIVRTNTEAQANAAAGRAEGRPELDGRRQEVLGRRGDEEQRRPADRRHQRRGGARAQRRRLRGARSSKLLGPDPRHVRLVRRRGDEDHAGDDQSRSPRRRRRSRRSCSAPHQAAAQAELTKDIKTELG